MSLIKVLHLTKKINKKILIDKVDFEIQIDFENSNFMNLKYLTLFQFTKYDIFLEAHSLYLKNPANFYSSC